MQKSSPLSQNVQSTKEIHLETSAIEHWKEAKRTILSQFDEILTAYLGMFLN